MIIVLKPGCSEEEIKSVEKKVIEFGYEPRIIRGVERTIIGAVGDETTHKSLETLQSLPLIENVMPVQKPYKMVSREFNKASSTIKIGQEKIGSGHFLMIAGPCSVESRGQMDAVAQDIVAAGVHAIRGGAYKPRTSPYDFQGLREEGLEILAEIKAKYGVAIVTEVVGVPHVERVAAVADVLQIGARNCQNYHLLEIVAGANRPVLLKRGFATTVKEWLLAAEYLIVHGCKNVILCERGIRTFENATRNTLDLCAVAVAKKETHLPVIVDPSHASGRVDLIVPLAKASIACGVDGLIVETHPNPPEACSDAAQQIPSKEFKQFTTQLKPLIDLCCQPRTDTPILDTQSA